MAYIEQSQIAETRSHSAFHGGGGNLTPKRVLSFYLVSNSYLYFNFNVLIFLNLFFQFLFAVEANCGLPHISVIGRSKIAPTQDAYGSGVGDDCNRPARPIPPPLNGNLNIGVAVLKFPFILKGWQRA